MLMLRLLALAGLFAGSVAAQPADLAAFNLARTAGAALDEPWLGEARSGAADDPSWTWSAEPRWLEGLPFGYASFGGGLDYGYRYFLGSSVDAASLVPVDIVFDEGMVTKGRVFRRDDGYFDGGAGTFRGAAYDMSDPSAPRRLNVSFVEDNRFQPVDGAWNPSSGDYGGREYLLVFASSYDGSGATYADQSAIRLDLLVALSSRVPTGRTLYETSPATLSLGVAPLRDVTVTAIENGVLAVRWAAPAFTGATDARIALDDGTGETLFATTDASAGALNLRGLDASTEYTVRVEIVDASGDVLASEAQTALAAISRGIADATVFDPGRSGGFTYGDVWGYTAADGTEYALLAGRGAGLSILDISAAPASAPVEVGFVPIAPGASDAKDVKVYGTHAYLVNEQGPIQIVDLDDPSSPVQVGTLDTQPGIPSGGAHNVAVFDGHLWVTGGRQSGNAGVRVYDVRTTPAAPVLVGAFRPDHFDSPYYHDFEVKGDYGFGPNIYGGGVDVLDVSDPANITRIATFTYPGSGAHNTCASENGQTLYVGDEIGSSGQWTRIFDISDVEDVEFAGEILVSEAASVHNCYVRDDILYIAHYTEGVRMFNIENPLAPAEVAFYDTFTAPGTGYQGAWTVYPYFASGKVIASDMQRGLVVLEPEAAALADEGTPALGAPALTLAPNPARGLATVRLALDAAAPVRLSVVDVQGREVRLLLDGVVAGPRSVDIEASTLAPGAYLVRLAVEGQAPVSRVLTVVR